MYGDGGTAYVYLCYGIHQMFNIVTATEDTPHAILIRAVDPIEGIETMLKRTGKKSMTRHSQAGPEMLEKHLDFIHPSAELF